MNIKDDEIVIGISQSKAVFQTSIAIVLFGFLIWFFYYLIVLPPAPNRTFLMICSSLLIATFGLASISGIKTLRTLEQGIVINKQGIKINFGPNRGHFVQWNEIIDLQLHHPVNGPFFLLIFVKNPNYFLSKSFGFKKFLLRMNNISHKTPVSIASNWLDCDIVMLEAIIRKKYAEYGAK